MTAAATRSDLELLPTVGERPLTSCIELVFAPPRNAAPGAVPGLAAHNAALHIAPGRWLLLDADARAVAAAVAGGAVATDVEGKWRCFEIRGARAASVLSAGVNVAVILEGRDCASVPLFDCPTVIARRPRDQGFDVYVHASYAASLRAALQMALQRMARS
jgi:heterotetrameric sarcosine oxidase gamma subunit